MECFICREQIAPRDNTVTIEVFASKAVRHATCTHVKDDKKARELALDYGIFTLPPLPDRGNYFSYNPKRTGTPLTADDVLDIRKEISCLKSTQLRKLSAKVGLSGTRTAKRLAPNL